MRLNKYIAHTGHCTRREASRLLLKGEIKVNGEVVQDESYKVMEDDKVTHNGKPLSPQITYQYLLINKPKKFSTDIEDKSSKYIMGLIKNCDPKGLQAVEDMGPDSVGLLILTDDAKLVERLKEKDRKIRRVYLIHLDKEISQEDIDKLLINEGTITISSASHVEGREPHFLGLELLKGSEKDLVSSIETIGYKVERIDCNYYAGLTKKDLKRGWSRPLSEMEERMMKHFI